MTNDLLLFSDGLLILILLIGLFSADRRARYWQEQAAYWRTLKIKRQDDTDYPMMHIQVQESDYEHRS